MSTVGTAGNARAVSVMPHLEGVWNRRGEWNVLWLKAGRRRVHRGDLQPGCQLFWSAGTSPRDSPGPGLGHPGHLGCHHLPLPGDAFPSPRHRSVMVAQVLIRTARPASFPRLLSVTGHRLVLHAAPTRL